MEGSDGRNMVRVCVRGFIVKRIVRSNQKGGWVRDGFVVCQVRVGRACVLVWILDLWGCFLMDYRIAGSLEVGLAESRYRGFDVFDIDGLWCG